MALKYHFLATVLICITASRVVISEKDNVCSYTVRRSFHNIDNPLRDENDYLTRSTVFRCCEGWTRSDGNREGNSPCNVREDDDKSTVEEIDDNDKDKMPHQVTDSFNWEEENDNKHEKIIQNLANLINFVEASDSNGKGKRHWDKKYDPVSQMVKKLKNMRKKSDKSLFPKCPIELPQSASIVCSSARTAELVTNSYLYNIGEAPNYNDPNRTLDELVAPLWDSEIPNTLFAAAFDKLEWRWLLSYVGMVVNNGVLTGMYSFTPQSKKQFKDICDWKDLFHYYYDSHMGDKTLTVNNSDLILDKWEDDGVFAEQQIAGINPFALKRLINKPCPSGWKLVGEKCFKKFTKHPHGNFQQSQIICSNNGGNLPDLSNVKEADKVNRLFQSASSPVYVDGTDGMWPDGTPVVGATNEPDTSRRYLTAQFAKSGLILTYADREWPEMQKELLCQRHANYGVPLSSIKHLLNSKFNWKKAIESKLASTSPHYKNTFWDAIDDGRIYVVEFPELRGIRDSPDINEEPNDGRTMSPLASPIAFFVSNPDIKHGEFLPVAIQALSTNQSAVYTPADGGNWKIAKMLVQSAAFTTAEIVEHLLHSHIVNGPICASYKRNIPSAHPLGQLLLQHCLGTLTTSIVAKKVLLPKGGKVDNIFTIGYHGQADILNNGFNKWSFNMNDPVYRLKKAGLLDKKVLPFHPYRDDGIELFNVIGEYTREYVDLYYASDDAVRKDTDIMFWADEIALGSKGTPYSGKGKIRDFPTTFNTRAQLAGVLQKFIWASSCHHAVANFPVIEFGGFVPNMPGKLYKLDHVSGFSLLRLPDHKQSLTQTEITFNLATLHYDKLFDYEANLRDLKAKTLVAKYKARMNTLQTKFVARNNANVKNGHLSYKYLHPDNVPNSIST